MLKLTFFQQQHLSSCKKVSVSEEQQTKKLADAILSFVVRFPKSAWSWDKEARVRAFLSRVQDDLERHAAAAGPAGGPARGVLLLLLAGEEGRASAPDGQPGPAHCLPPRFHR
eukprot:227008-Hanusia_phi.AAC.2